MLQKFMKQLCLEDIWCLGGKGYSDSVDSYQWNHVVVDYNPGVFY